MSVRTSRGQYPPPEPGLEAFQASERALLERAEPAFLCSRIRGPPFVSVGIGVRDDGGLAARSRRQGVPIVRRHTGGTALLHLEGDLLWSVVLPRSDPRIARGFVHAYGLLGAPVVAFLRGLGIASSWEEPPGRSTTYCTLGARGRVLQVGGQVVGGAAQHATATALVHHGTVSWTVDRELLLELFGPELKAPSELLGGINTRVPPDAVPNLAALLEEELGRFVAAR